MNISPDQTLAEIVDTVSGAARLLEAFGLDYCCGGQQTLQAACDNVGLSSAEIVDRLGALGPGEAADWLSMSPDVLVDLLESTHHAYLHAELPRLVALADKVAGVHGERHNELTEVQQLCVALRDDLVPHMLKEEQVLFPMIRELASAESAPSFHCDSLTNPISRMMLEHEEVGALLEKIRAVTNGYLVPEDACGSYLALYDGLRALESDTHLHVHKENNTLFPMVVDLERGLSAP